MACSSFLGRSDDRILGNEGQDTLVGDFGYINMEVEILPNRHLVSIIDQADYGGSDHLEGNEDDDLLIGGEGMPVQTDKCLYTSAKTNTWNIRVLTR